MGGILLLVLMVAIIVALGFTQIETPAEPGLVAKLAGYSMLGMSSVALARVNLPVGIAASLLFASLADDNRRARYVTASLAFLVWVVGRFVG